MGRLRCAVPNCEVTDGPGFHVGRNLFRLKNWGKVINNPQINDILKKYIEDDTKEFEYKDYILLEKKRICRVHFDINCFRITNQRISNTLKSTAIPTLFLNLPQGSTAGSINSSIKQEYVQQITNENNNNVNFENEEHNVASNFLVMRYGTQNGIIDEDPPVEKVYELEQRLQSAEARIKHQDDVISELKNELAVSKKIWETLSETIHEVTPPANEQSPDDAGAFDTESFQDSNCADFPTGDDNAVQMLDMPEKSIPLADTSSLFSLDATEILKINDNKLDQTSNSVIISDKKQPIQTVKSADNLNNLETPSTLIITESSPSVTKLFEVDDNEPIQSAMSADNSINSVAPSTIEETSQVSSSNATEFLKTDGHKLTQTYGLVKSVDNSINPDKKSSKLTPNVPKSLKTDECKPIQTVKFVNNSINFNELSSTLTKIPAVSLPSVTKSLKADNYKTIQTLVAVDKSINSEASERLKGTKSLSSPSVTKSLKADDHKTIQTLTKIPAEKSPNVPKSLKIDNNQPMKSLKFADSPINPGIPSTLTKTALTPSLNATKTLKIDDLKPVKTSKSADIPIKSEVSSKFKKGLSTSSPNVSKSLKTYDYKSIQTVKIADDVPIISDLFSKLAETSPPKPLNTFKSLKTDDNKPIQTGKCANNSMNPKRTSILKQTALESSPSAIKSSKILDHKSTNIMTSANTSNNLRLPSTFTGRSSVTRSLKIGDYNSIKTAKSADLPMNSSVPPTLLRMSSASSSKITKTLSNKRSMEILKIADCPMTPDESQLKMVKIPLSKINGAFYIHPETGEPMQIVKKIKGNSNSNATVKSSNYLVAVGL